MTAAIWYETEAYQTDRPRLMGRQSAGLGFLTALLRHSPENHFTAVMRNAADGRAFIETARAVRPDARATLVPIDRLGQVRREGCLYYPALIEPKLAWARNWFGPRSFSLCGVTHTISSRAAASAITSWPTAPLQPWDAVVCTSKAVRDAVGWLVETQMAELKERVGATRFTLPQLPVIPLGVDCDAQAIAPRDRAGVRAALGIAETDLVVLFVGRLSFHAKANPFPMYLALERLAARHRIVLVECGWTGNDWIAQSFAAARAEICPGVRSIELDGRNPDTLRQAWGCADIFCSLSDNIQESFGLTPIEAMAAGLSCVVTDWNGYRDTVRDGHDGFCVPTMTPPHGSGIDLAHAQIFDIDRYDIYIARAAAATVVDIEAAARALQRLADEPDLRRRMGASGQARARELFDWKVIVAAYRRLWDELAARRKEPAQEREVSRGRLAQIPDPFDLFAGYPTTLLSAAHQVRLRPEAETAAFEQRLSLEITLLRAIPGLDLKKLTTLRDKLRGPPVTVGTLMRGFNNGSATLVMRGIMLMAKFGLVEIVPPDRAESQQPKA
jgi:glycosyltransferase involved in cell wall biosynthesis